MESDPVIVNWARSIGPPVWWHVMIQRWWDFGRLATDKVRRQLFLSVANRLIYSVNIRASATEEFRSSNTTPIDRHCSSRFRKKISLFLYLSKVKLNNRLPLEFSLLRSPDIVFRRRLHCIDDIHQQIVEVRTCWKMTSLPRPNRLALHRTLLRCFNGICAQFVRVLAAFLRLEWLVLCDGPCRNLFSY